MAEDSENFVGDREDGVPLVVGHGLLAMEREGLSLNPEHRLSIGHSDFEIVTTERKDLLSQLNGEFVLVLCPLLETSNWQTVQSLQGNPLLRHVLMIVRIGRPTSIAEMRVLPISAVVRVKPTCVYMHVSIE